MKPVVEFKPWPKITRINPFKVVITEKMDGTNACIIIDGGKIVGVQSRKRFITPGADNFGFAGWVARNEEDLLKLGEGYHYGEWVGPGIQSNPHDLPEKRFFLFNTGRWDSESVPESCSVVRILFEGIMDINTVPEILERLQEEATEAETPEGVVVYYISTCSSTKHTIKSPNGKWCKD